MHSQEEKTSYKDWDINKKEKPENVTNDDNGDTVPFTEVHCTR